MPIDLDQIRSNYANMDDAKLERIAKFDTASIQLEIYPIIIAEIRKRGLDESLIPKIELQSMALTDGEIYTIIDKIRGLRCPSCKNYDQELLGGLIQRIVSRSIINQYEEIAMIACRHCIDTERMNQLFKNNLLEWCLQYLTPQVIIDYFRDDVEAAEISESVLFQFSIQNIEELKANWDNEDRLVEYIHQLNIYRS